MDNLEILKQELLAQKAAIESKGGTVVVAENNPSPSEITAGINTIIAVSNAAITNSRSTNAEQEVSSTMNLAQNSTAQTTIDNDICPMSEQR